MTAWTEEIFRWETGRLAMRQASPWGWWGEELESVSNAAERLGAMGQAVDVQRGHVDVRAVVDQSPVSGAEEYPIGDINISAAAVQECSAGLRVGGGHVVGSKHQSARSG